MYKIPASFGDYKSVLQLSVYYAYVPVESNVFWGRTGNLQKVVDCYDN